MGYTICIVNQKGGVGKTTTALNLAAALALSSRETLLLDCDPQGNATMGMGINRTRPEKSIYHGLTGQAAIEDLIVDTGTAHLKVVPSHRELSRVEKECLSRPGKERILRDLLTAQRQRFDYIIIDSPPSLGLLTVNGMVAADRLVIPLQCEFLALTALEQLLRMIRILKKKLNPGVKIAGVLLTMFEKDEALSRQIVKQVRKNLNGLVFETMIPRNPYLPQSAARGIPLPLMDEKGGDRSYFDLAKELITRDGTLAMDP